MRARILVLVALVALCLPGVAWCDRRPTLATDGVYVGMRVDPGTALVAVWDLDIYLLRNRGISLGPGVSFAVLGRGAHPGREQDFLLAADVLRLKIGLNAPGGEFRPFFLFGGGFSYVRMSEQVESGVAVVPADNRAAPPVTGQRIHPALEEFAPMLTLGAGADVFTRGPVAMTTLLQSHVHLSGTDRMPDVWLELALGVRFGI